MNTGMLRYTRARRDLQIDPVPYPKWNEGFAETTCECALNPEFHINNVCFTTININVIPKIILANTV